MILQALAAYYEALAAKGEIARQGWGKVRVRYALEIDGTGRLLSLLPLESVNEKGKPVPRQFELPAPVKRASNVAANFLWDNAAYLLGIDGKGKPERTIKCFEAAKALHLALLSKSEDAFAKAICAFFLSWEPNGAEDHPLLSEHMGELLAGANLTFFFQGMIADYGMAVGKIWQEYYDGGDALETGAMRCLVTGKMAIPAKIHPSIMRVYGAQSSGATLVSFNAPAFCSYGKEQNLNAPVSKSAAFAYTTALNQLLADGAHVKRFGDTTVVYWAENAEAQYQDAFGCMMEGSSVTDQDLNGVMEALSKGRPVEWGGLPLEPDNRFYVLGLSPSAARLSVRFFLTDRYSSFVRHVEEHYQRLEIARPEFDKVERLSMWRLLRETVNLNARDKSASPQMAGDMLRAVLTGTRYPSTLYQHTELRIRAEKNITHGRAAIIKAYLLRNFDDPLRKEPLTVQLNEETTYQPYILGRLFSILEAIQQKANPGINTTIKDKYLTSACATPAVVFPILTNLAEKHLRKMEDKYRIFYSKQLCGLMAQLTESYPAHLSLNDQGVFQLGYYHQKQKRFEKKNKENANTEEDKENV